MKGKLYVRRMLMLVLAGAILAIAGYLLGGSTSIRWRSGGPEVVPRTSMLGAVQETQLVQDVPFSVIDIDIAVGDIVIERGAGHQVVMRTERKGLPEFSVEGGVLKLRDSRDTQGGFRVGFSALSEDVIVVTVPNDVRLTSIDARSGTGAIGVKGIDADTLRLRMPVGDMELANVRCAELDVIVNNGDVRLRDVRTEDRCSVSMDVGDISGNGTFLGDVSLRVDMGSIDVRTDVERAAYRVDAQVDLGSISLNPNRPDEPSAPNKLLLRSNVGDIEFAFKE